MHFHLANMPPNFEVLCLTQAVAISWSHCFKQIAGTIGKGLSTLVNLISGIPKTLTDNFDNILTVR